MSFVMPTAARSFFHTITERTVPGARYIMFDTYYICALLGLEARKLGAKEDLDSDRFIEHYPEDYKQQADFIAGLLIDAELDRKNIDVLSKVAVEREMILLLDPSNSIGLSSDGADLLNRYAAGGFTMIEQEMTKPAKLEDLLVKYATMWQSAEV